MRKPRFYHLGDLLMKSPALRLVDRTVQRFLEQRVLKEVSACWRLTFDVEDAGRHQLCQLGPQRLFVDGHDGSEQLVVKLAAQRGGELGHLAVA